MPRRSSRNKTARAPPARAAGPARPGFCLVPCPQDKALLCRAITSQAARRADVADTHPGILAIFNNVAPGREADFEEWFQHEHLEERLRVPGFLIGRRHEAIVGQPRYFNFYVTQS